MISSIGKLFTKEHYEAKPDSAGPNADNEECFPCMATSAVLLMGLGAAFGSGMVFKSKEGTKPLNLSPTYVRTVRGIGFLLVPLGIYRSWRAWEVYKEENHQLK